MFDALLQNHDVVCMLLAGHVYAKVSGYVSLIVAHLAPKRRFGLLINHWAVHGWMLAARRPRAHG